jgi:hypothetical protein
VNALRAGISYVSSAIYGTDNKSKIICLIEFRPHNPDPAALGRIPHFCAGSSTLVLHRPGTHYAMWLHILCSWPSTLALHRPCTQYVQPYMARSRTSALHRPRTDPAHECLRHSCSGSTSHFFVRRVGANRRGPRL